MEKVRVIYHQEPEGWWAESPDIPGWSAAGESYSEVRALVEDGVGIAIGRGEASIEHFVPADTVLTT